MASIFTELMLTNKESDELKNIRKLMIKLKMSFKEAIQFLDIPEDEVKEIEKIF